MEASSLNEYPSAVYDVVSLKSLFSGVRAVIATRWQAGLRSVMDTVYVVDL